MFYVECDECNVALLLLLLLVYSSDGCGERLMSRAVLWFVDWRLFVGWLMVRFKLLVRHRICVNVGNLVVPRHTEVSGHLADKVQSQPSPFKCKIYHRNDVFLAAAEPIVALRFFPLN